MRRWHIRWALLLTVMVLAGCRGSTPTPAADAGLGNAYTSEVLDTSYPSALNASGQLMLGTIKLEGTEHAVTPGQAKALLPLWQAFQSGALQASAERNAVLAQIEAQMTPAQLEAIADMQLTPDDLRAWMEEQGLGMGSGLPGTGEGQEVPPEAQATRQAQFAGGQEIPPEMATRRAQFESMSEEQRAAFRATAEAGGMPARAGPGPRQPIFLLRPLIELLEARAGEEQ